MPGLAHGWGRRVDSLLAGRNEINEYADHPALRTAGRLRNVERRLASGMTRIFRRVSVVSQRRLVVASNVLRSYTAIEGSMYICDTCFLIYFVSVGCNQH